jgi:hypothetical protein
MATLTAAELTELRQGSCREQTVDFTKATINAALQAIEDWYETNKATGSTAIDTATSPYVFSNPFKKRLFAYWNKQKFGREGV